MPSIIRKKKKFLFVYKIFNLIKMFFVLYIVLFKCYILLSNNAKKKIIISMTSDHKRIKNIEKIIDSILEQKVDSSSYKIILILSYFEYKKIKVFPKKLLILLIAGKFRLIIRYEKLNLQSRLIIAINEYPDNPILLINDNILFPEGWLEMFIKDHNSYPKNIICASIQYFFGKKLLIKQFTEGYNGKNFGKFNHITNMIFNFGIINTNIGGTLFPPHSIKSRKFFDEKLFLKVSKLSDEFWQSCFIMMDNLTIRQSSKIYDYTQYMINNYKFPNKIKLYEKIKIFFFKYFPEIENIIKLRQNKIIACFTSYYKRFDFLNDVINSIKNQTKLPNRIILFLSKLDKKKFNLNISGIDIIEIGKDIRPHNKYYYPMELFKEYAIITFDDDIIYSKDMIESLFNNYIEHPNIVSGRRSHLIKYKNNNEIESYYNWVYEQKRNFKPDFNIFLTAVGGIIYPPDILNINEKDIPLINEVITTDDILVKYFEINKGIESMWVHNIFMQGIEIKENEIHSPLFIVNKKNNDININKLNIDINNILLKDWCINYKNVKTGLSIDLFNMNYYKFQNNKYSSFTIDAYSHCPINNKIKFKIFFESISANCKFKFPYSIINYDNKTYKTKKILKAFCNIKKNVNIYNYKFPYTRSRNNIKIKFYYYKLYLTIIFYDFNCIDSKICIMRALFYKTFAKGYIANININNIEYTCILLSKVIYNNKIPILGSFKCFKSNITNDNNIVQISGLPKKLWTDQNINNYSNLNHFVISLITVHYYKNSTQLIIKGKLNNKIGKDIKNLEVSFINPRSYLDCTIPSESQYVFAFMFCNYNKTIKNEILIENQIVFINNEKQNILLILNEQIFYQNYEIINLVLSNPLYLYEFNNNTLLEAFLLLIFYFIIKIKLYKKHFK